MSQSRPSSNPSPGERSGLFSAYITFAVGLTVEFTRTRRATLTWGTVRDACTRFECVSGPVARVIVFSSAFALDCLVLLADRFYISAKAVVTQGHGIASGKTYDVRFPNGTLAMQAPFSRTGNEPFGVFSRYFEPIRSSLFLSTGYSPLFFSSSQMDALPATRELLILPMRDQVDWGR